MSGTAFALVSAARPITVVRMARRKLGLVLLNVAGVLVIAGSLYDLFVPSVPRNHLVYLGQVEGTLDPRYAALDLAMLRSIGGCLLAIGITVLVLSNIPIRRGDAWARVTVVVLVGLAEGNNSYRMFAFGSPWYGPLGFVVIAATGALLAKPLPAVVGEYDRLPKVPSLSA